MSHDLHVSVTKEYALHTEHQRTKSVMEILALARFNTNKAICFIYLSFLVIPSVVCTLDLNCAHLRTHAIHKYVRDSMGTTLIKTCKSTVDNNFCASSRRNSFNKPPPQSSDD